MRVLRLVVTLSVVFCVTILAAQQQTDKKPVNEKPAASAPEGMMPTPGPEIVKYSKIVLGTWTVNESHDANDMMPAGTSSGTSTFSQGPGEFSVVENLSMTGSFGAFKGMGVVWWEPGQQVFRSMWCDSMTPKCDTSTTARWQGDKLVAEGNMEMPDGNKMYTRSEYTDITPNSLTLVMYSGPNATSAKKFMTLKYTRASSSAK